MANNQISSDPINYLRNLEVFFKNKMLFKNLAFFHLPTRVKGFFPRKVITSSKNKNFKLSLTSKGLKEIKSDNYLLKKNKITMILGKDIEGIYLAQGELSSKTVLNEEFLPIFLKYISSNLSAISSFQKELSLVDVDDVTGLYNQRRLFKDLAIQAKKNKTTNLPFSVMFIDIDHFKSVNDGSGHLVGSQLLSDLAKRLKDVLRTSDTFYRYGGDEFVIIFPGVSTSDGLKIGKRILKKIKEKPFKVDDLKDSFNLSVSIGLATFPTHVKSVDGVLELADNMLYRAKELGRGRVCSVTEIFGKH